MELPIGVGALQIRHGGTGRRRQRVAEFCGSAVAMKGQVHCTFKVEGANWIMGSTLFFGYFLLFYFFLILETKDCEDLKDRYREVSKMVFPREKISQK